MEKVIHISGEVGWENTPTTVKDAIASHNLQPKDTLRVVINSEGGSVFDGFDIYNQLKALPNEIVTEVRGIAASIASLIMLAGNRVEMSEASLVMIHRAMTMAMGNAEEIEKQISILNKIDSILVDVYAAKTGLPTSDVEDLLSEETWFTGEEAVEAGLANNLIHLVDAKFAAQLLFTTKQKKMALKDLFSKLRLKAVVGPDNEETQEEGTEATEETTEEGTEEETPQPENVTREEFDALVEAMELMAAAIDALPVEGEEEEETEEETTEEETTEETAAVTEEQVDAIIENKVRAIVGNLKKSNGQPPKGNNSLTNGPKGYVDKYAGFRAEQAELESQTRN